MLFASLFVLTLTSSLMAHHALTNYDTTQAVRVKGTVLQFHHMNPHTIIYLESKDADGQVRRWAVEGPATLQLTRRGVGNDVLKPGDAIEVCGYLPKEPIVWQVANPDKSGPSLSGRLFNAEMIVMPNGKQLNWGDYGIHRCFGPGYSDQHTQ